MPTASFLLKRITERQMERRNEAQSGNHSRNQDYIFICFVKGCMRYKIYGSFI